MNYLLESSVCITIFYGFYYLIFRRLTFIRLNRIYLLSSLVGGLSLPLISYQIKEIVKIPARVEYEETISMPLAMNSSAPLISNTHIEESFDWSTVLQGIYIIGIVLMTIKLLYSLKNIFKLIIEKKSKKSINPTNPNSDEVASDNFYISTQSKYANSSFFNLIFIDDSNLSENEINQILEHEKWHIQLFHSYDLLFVEILKIIFWFNPILWLYQRSLSEVHEYEVDTRMIQAYNPQTYAQLLLKLATSTSQLSTTHQFSRKPLTDRIHFLFTKQKSVPMKRLAYLSVLPILGVFFMAFSVEKVVDYQVVEESSKYFKIVRKDTDSIEFGNVNVTDYNKVSPTLYLYKNKIAFTTGSNEISEAMINDVAKYFKNYDYTLSVLGRQLDENKKNLEKIEIGLVDDKKDSKERVKKVNKNFPENNEKFNFDLKKMRAKSARSIGGAITIMANRYSGLHFVAPLSPPPPPPAPPKAPKQAPPAPPKPPLPPVKVGMNEFKDYYLTRPIYADKEMNRHGGGGIMHISNHNNQLILCGIDIGKGKLLSQTVTQKDWQIFLEYINNDNYFSTEFRKNMIPDYWNKIKVKSEKLPVKFVSFDQANEYCKWQSQMFSFHFQNNKKPSYKQIISSNSKLAWNCRLPTEKEWEQLWKKYPQVNGFCYILETNLI
jgi:beta-lactamase regulating signal transducer with metallopeptidase domain